MDNSPTPGDVVPGLEVIEELGRGAHTVVYRARGDDGQYALKLLGEPVDDGGQALAAVRREAALLACVQHPGVARVYEVGEVRGRPYLVMELVEGQSPDTLAPGGSLAEDRLIALGIDVAGALAAAHRRGLVHRDIKPDNILIQADGRARLIDFGLAALDHATGTEGAVAGTLVYSAPEQTGMIKRAVDGRADLYALGVTLFQCATGALPFVADNVGELLHLHATAPVPDPRTLRPDLSPGLAAVIRRLLAKDPDDRFQSAAELIGALERLPAGAHGEVGERPIAVADTPLGGALVGRDQELATLLTAWERARGGGGGVMLVQGPAGSGKSRLVQELADAAGRAGALVLSGTCVEGDPVPLAVLRAAVDRHLQQVERFPEPRRGEALERVRAAAGPAAALLQPLSPRLGALLGASDGAAEEDRHDQVAAAVSAFLAQLARAHDGMVLVLDGVQWLDPATRAVVRHLAVELAGAPLLVVATARDDDTSRATLTAITSELDGVLDPPLTLGPLDEQAIARLVATQLAGAAVPQELVTQLARRAGGSPFTVLEYLRAMVEAGLILPSWGTWVLDNDALDRLELPADVIDLVVARIDGLGRQARRLLTAAAATGTRFEAGLLAQLCDVGLDQTLDVLSDAVGRQLVEPRGRDEYAFLHDQIREALLAEVDPHALRRLHQRIAELLAAQDTQNPDRIYAVAHHYAQGTMETPDQLFHASLAAGRLALAAHAPAQAMAFLEQAAAVAPRAGITLDSDFLQSLGVACMRAGRFTQAAEHLEAGLEVEPDPVRRGVLRNLLARIHLVTRDMERSKSVIHQGLADLGCPLPRNIVALVLSTLARFVAGVLLGRFKRLGFATATGSTRDHHRAHVSLLEALTYVAAGDLQLWLLPVAAMRALYGANRLGPSAEYVRVHTVLAMTAGQAGWRRSSERGFRRAARIAADLGDPTLSSYVAIMRGLPFLLAGGRTDVLERAFREHSRWVEASDYVSLVPVLAKALAWAGRTRDAEVWIERLQARLAVTGQTQGGPMEATAAALSGRAAEARATLRTVTGPVHASRPPNLMERVEQATYAALVAAEEDDYGAEFDAALSEFAGLRLPLASLWGLQRMIFVLQAFGRLAQCRRATAERRDERLDAARQAVQALDRAANSPLVRAYAHTAHAGYLQLRGDQAGALKRLERADRLVWQFDLPLVAYEIARVRARALLVLGNAGEAGRQARFALMLAADHGWEHRARWIRAEFDDVKATGSEGRTVSGHATSTTSGFAGALDNRRLGALQQVSLAAASVLEPAELARVALRETMRIFAAERAFLFLLEEGSPHGGERLVPYLGRDSEGHDLEALTGYSTTLLEQVRVAREALVATGGEEGAALSSQSALLHGLRSIMAAPLQLGGRLLGVVYLDSRVAKGIFTSADIDLLVAITNHVAVSLETARAAQLEITVQAERHQRSLAESLRDATAELSGIRDPATVLSHTLTAVTTVVGADRGCILLRSGAGEVVVAATHGVGPSDQAREARLPEGSIPSRLASPCTGSQVTPLPPPLAAVLGPAESWLSVPLAIGDSELGVLLLVAAGPDAYGGMQLDIASAFAAQGAIAYDNAVLFQRVEQLAITDGLTGVANRRHLMDQASRLMAAAQRHDLPLAALMLDIDHFKRVNDTFGHAAGDQVIRTVAQRLADTIRKDDLLGRYGGEEFALVVHETPEGAAELAERLRLAIAATPVPCDHGHLPVTVSVGVASLTAEDSTPDALFALADTALYRAKQDGRDRVAVHDRTVLRTAR